MSSFLRRLSSAASILACATLTACAIYPAEPQPMYSGSGYQIRPAARNTGYGTELARVSRIDVLQSPPPQQASGIGALVGAVIGGVLGNQIGHGGGRAVATGIGAVGGAVLGNALEGDSGGGYGRSYRITLRMDQGGFRSYDVPSPGDLRAGDRVQVYQGQISRY